jgi:hypothetical protein
MAEKILFSELIHCLRFDVVLWIELPASFIVNVDLKFRIAGCAWALKKEYVLSKGGDLVLIEKVFNAHIANV